MANTCTNRFINTKLCSNFYLKATYIQACNTQRLEIVPVICAPVEEPIVEENLPEDP